MEQQGVENPERFSQEQQQIPPEIQQVLLQRPDVQIMMKGYADAQAGQTPQGQQIPQGQVQ